jgi:hypothetical protein
MNRKGYGSNPRLIEPLPWHFPEGAEQTHEKNCKNSQCLSWDSNQVWPYYCYPTCLVIPSNCDVLTQKSKTMRIECALIPWYITVTKNKILLLPTPCSLNTTGKWIHAYIRTRGKRWRQLTLRHSDQISQPLQTLSPLPKSDMKGCLMRNHELIQIRVTKGNKYATDVAGYNSNRTPRRKQDFCSPMWNSCVPWRVIHSVPQLQNLLKVMFKFWFSLFQCFQNMACFFR